MNTATQALINWQKQGEGRYYQMTGFPGYFGNPGFCIQLCEVDRVDNLDIINSRSVTESSSTENMVLAINEALHRWESGAFDSVAAAPIHWPGTKVGTKEQ